jgi:hypothetical protein
MMGYTLRLTWQKYGANFLGMTGLHLKIQMSTGTKRKAGQTEKSAGVVD